MRRVMMMSSRLGTAVMIGLVDCGQMARGLDGTLLQTKLHQERNLRLRLLSVLSIYCNGTGSEWNLLQRYGSKYNNA